MDPDEEAAIKAGKAIGDELDESAGRDQVPISTLARQGRQAVLERETAGVVL